MTRPRAIPFSASARAVSLHPARAAAWTSFPFFFSVLYLSDSKFAAINPSVMLCAAADVPSPSRAKNTKRFTERVFKWRSAAPAVLRSCAPVNCSRFPAPISRSRCAFNPAGLCSKVISSVLPVNSPLCASLRIAPAAARSSSATRPSTGSLCSNTYVASASVSMLPSGRVSSVISMSLQRLRER